mmetsp:Transcript_34904/g.81645  ORF Transcript_34904/g.81645 Transcript_34904/m.81645 type:complete len:398 (-) Transcript_34904:32-1225(-)
MQVSHQMDEKQVEMVLTEFNATTTAVRGIEDKMGKTIDYMVAAKQQQHQITTYSLQVLQMVETLGKSLQLLSDDVLESVSLMAERFASLFEVLELTFMEMGLVSVAKELQTEMWPLLVPVVCLVLVVSGSNCAFGFRLAADPDMVQLGLEGLVGMEETGSTDLADGDNEGMNLLNLFAIFHVVLVSLAVLYLIAEAMRRVRLKVKLAPGGKRTDQIGQSGPSHFFSSGDVYASQGSVGEPAGASALSSLAASPYASRDGQGGSIDQVSPPADPATTTTSPNLTQTGSTPSGLGGMYTSPSTATGLALGPTRTHGPASLLRRLHEASAREVQRRKGEASSPLERSPRAQGGRTRRQALQESAQSARTSDGAEETDADRAVPQERDPSYSDNISTFISL